MRIAYLGIDLLWPALRTLLEQGHQIVRVFTCPTDNITEFNTQVVAAAAERRIPLSMQRLTADDLSALQKQGCELLLCAGYYYKIPVTDAFPMVNIHSAPLPAWRGAWPMPWMLLRGEAQGGVCIHEMTAALDEGRILMQQTFDLPPQATLGQYMDRVHRLLPGMLSRLLDDLPGYLRAARPQGEGRYWPSPAEADWTILPTMAREQAELILRAFDGYEIVYRTKDQKYELLDAWVDERWTAGAFPLKNGWLHAQKHREL